MKRRQFLKSSALATIGLSLGTLETACARDNSKTSKVPYAEGGSADIIVAGGGPAGISAAVTAARLGKKVLLLEAGSCLGGVWTRGEMCCCMDFGKSEIAKEIIARLDAKGARIARKVKMDSKHFLFIPESMKLVLEEMCVEAGVDFIYHCPVVDVEKDKSGKNITAVFTESKSGRQRWEAKIFFDTTGDGDLAFKAGCGFDFGGENEGDNDQPASIQGVVVIDDDSKIAEFINNDPGNFKTDTETLYNVKTHFREYAHKCGSDAPAPNLVRLRKNLLGLSCGFEYGVRVDDVRSITNAMVQSRREMHELVRILTTNGGERWKGLTIVSTSENIGQRAARRIHGRYTITNEDIINGATFEDAVARSTSIVDVHATKKGEAYMLDTGVKAKPFDIPLRACRPVEIDNLFLAGKSISGGFYPMASYRMTGPATEMGENIAKKVCELI